MAYEPPKSAEELLERYASGERDFRGISLTDVDLSEADLSRADFSTANFSGANLSGTKLIRAELIGSDFSGANLNGANLSGADLEAATFGRVCLRGADLSLADIGETNLDGADLSGADMSCTNLWEVSLKGTDLRGADLGGADIFSVDLRGADLRSTNLYLLLLASSNLDGANFGSARLNNTCLSRVSLIEICKADPPIVHEGPSSIDFESITLSLLAPNLENFLIRAGIPAIAAQYMIESAQAVKGSVWDMMQSAFISFGGPDEPFARKLYEALHGNGVRTFFFPEHAEPGKPLHRLMRDAVKDHDRVILICSKDSLTRNGVLVEIEESLRRESKQGGEMILIPITIDNFIYGDKDGSNQWQPPDSGTRDAILARVVADFRGVDIDPTKFDVEVSKLVRALRVKNPASTTP